MKIDFRELRKKEEPVTLQGTMEMSSVEEGNTQVMAIDPVRAELTALMTDDDICHVEGWVSTEITYQCSRCLDSFRAPLRSKLNELFSNEHHSEDEEIHWISEDEFDLDPYLEESVNLALEYRPLCSLDCKGLCPTCGVNRNHEACDCESNRPVDIRFAALEGLLSKEDPK